MPSLKISPALVLNSLANSNVCTNTVRKNKIKIQAKDPNQILKRWVWIYFFLLLFEGSLRKWVLPSLAVPLLVVRDPVALFLLLTAWQRDLLPKTPYLYIVIIIGVISIFTGIFGHANIVVSLYGARILLLHYPLMFIIGRVFTRADIIKMGKVILFISIFMSILIGLQFYSPQSAWVNRAAGGMEGAGFSGALGYYRPPGTFSFATGTVLFFGLLAPFVLYFWIHRNNINFILLILATLSLLAAIPFSISRSLFFSVIISAFFLIISVLQQPKYIGKVLLAIVAIVIVFAVLSQAGFFGTSTEAFTTRLEGANETEGGLKGVFADRYLGGLIGSLESSSETPFWGYGIGSGSTAGLSMLGAEIVRGTTEGEWGKWIYELGPLMGLIIILLRVTLTTKIFIASYHKLKVGDFLPWMLTSVGLFLISQGEWSQPTSLGFNVLTGGLIIASLRKSV